MVDYEFKLVSTYDKDFYITITKCNLRNIRIEKGEDNKKAYIVFNFIGTVGNDFYCEVIPISGYYKYYDRKKLLTYLDKHIYDKNVIDKDDLIHLVNDSITYIEKELRKGE